MLVHLVSKAGIGDGCMAAEPSHVFSHFTPARFGDFAEPAVYLGIHPANEERGHALDPGQAAAGGVALLKAGEEGFEYSLVTGE